MPNSTMTRKASGKMWISTAFWLPSAWGMPVTPMNEFCLISDSEALTTPRTATLSAIFTLYVVWPSRDLTVSIGPSTPSTVPRTRTVDDCCWAKVADVATSKTKPAAPKARRVILSIVIPPNVLPVTNATVAQMVKAVEGDEITLKYKDGEKKIVVVPNTTIVTYVPADKSELKPGAKIFIAAANKKEDGTLEAATVSVGRDGITPPM
jgi:hypothetical protein